VKVFNRAGAIFTNCMYPSEDDIEVDLSPRDVAIMKARIKYPAASVRKLRDILEEEYDISLSHNRVNDILREIKSEELFQTFGAPNKNLFDYHLFRIAFHYPSFEERWEECHTDLVNDPHVVMFFNADSYHQWQFITQFRTSEEGEQWMHEFLKKHGDLIAQFDKTALPTVHKFHIDAGILDDVLKQTEEGQKYLESSLIDEDDATSDGETDVDDTEAAISETLIDQD
jgi:hypothetical protein